MSGQVLRVDVALHVISLSMLVLWSNNIGGGLPSVLSSSFFGASELCSPQRVVAVAVLWGRAADSIFRSSHPARWNVSTK